jgi:hypothetical protein
VSKWNEKFWNQGAWGDGRSDDDRRNFRLWMLVIVACVIIPFLLAVLYAPEADAEAPVACQDQQLMYAYDKGKLDATMAFWAACNDGMEWQADDGRVFRCGQVQRVALP